MILRLPALEARAVFFVAPHAVRDRPVGVTPADKCYDKPVKRQPGSGAEEKTIIQIELTSHTRSMPAGFSCFPAAALHGKTWPRGLYLW